MDSQVSEPEVSAAAAAGTRRTRVVDLIRLVRPKQWAKCGFVLIGPLYALADGHHPDWVAVAIAVWAFGCASSFCYILNDIRDVEADRMHPRKKRRPIASGAVSVPVARSFAVVMALIGMLPLVAVGERAFLWVAATVVVYIANVVVYSTVFKRYVIMDVISLAMGFVLRVLGGCAAAMVVPSAWLLNCTFFLAMFLAFGKRLGERRTMHAAGVDASAARAVQSVYTDDLLRMVVVVTAVATLITYAGYVQARGEKAPDEMNFLWLTMLPATYGMFRCMVLLEQGRFDDPTELAAGDRAFQVSVALFGVITLAVFAYVNLKAAG